MEHAKEQGASERHPCQLVNQPRGTQRYQPTPRNDEDALTRAIIALASQYGRYGYRRITIKLKEPGWDVGKDCVERIWRREGLKVPQKQKPRDRLWLNDGSCVRLRPQRPNHIWSYDFVSAFTHDGRTVRFLNLIDEYTRECLAIHAGRRINSNRVIEVLTEAIHAAAPKAQDMTSRRTKYKNYVDEEARRKNTTTARVRAKVEHPFRILKRVFGFTKVRYRGIWKNHQWLCAAFALVNLYMHRNRLAPQGA